MKTFKERLSAWILEYISAPEWKERLKSETVLTEQIQFFSNMALMGAWLLSQCIEDWVNSDGDFQSEKLMDYVYSEMESVTNDTVRKKDMN